MGTRNGGRPQGLNSPEEVDFCLEFILTQRDKQWYTIHGNNLWPTQGYDCSDPVVSSLAPHNSPQAWCVRICPLSKVHEKLKQWPLFTLIYVLKALWFIEQTQIYYCIWPSWWLWGHYSHLMGRELEAWRNSQWNGVRPIPASVSRYFLSLSLTHLQATSES